MKLTLERILGRSQISPLDQVPIHMLRNQIECLGWLHCHGHWTKHPAGLPLRGEQVVGETQENGCVEGCTENCPDGCIEGLLSADNPPTRDHVHSEASLWRDRAWEPLSEHAYHIAGIQCGEREIIRAAIAYSEEIFLK